MSQEMSRDVHIYVADRHAQTTSQRDARSRVSQQLREGKMPTFEDMAAARGLVLREREHSIFSDAWVPLAVLFFIGGLIASRNLALLALGTVLLLIVLVSSWWKSNALVGIDYEREFDRMRVFPDEPIHLKLKVSNQKPLPLTWLQFEDKLPIPPVEEGVMAEMVGDTAGFYNLQTNFSISGHGYIERNYTLMFKRRGYYQVGPVRHRSGDLFTMFTIERDYNYLENIVIYPQIYPLETLGLPPKEPFGELPVWRSLFTDPIHTQGIRDYHPSDRFRDVHWKASARRGDLQTKIYEPSTGMTMAIFLNVAIFERHWMGFDPDILERSISVAGSVAAYGVEAKWGVGLFVNGSVPRSDQPIRVPAGRSPDQLSHVLEALAATTEFATGSIERLMQRESPRLPWIATLVLVTANVTESMAVTVTRLKEAGRRICLICLAETLPEFMPPVLTYHVPSTIAAFKNGSSRANDRYAQTEASLRRIPLPKANGNQSNEDQEGAS